MHTRRSIREYRDKDIPECLVSELCKTAMVSPSARNQQPLRQNRFESEQIHVNH
ncbi:MAG: nitroreductase family protein [Anaerolineales bacterium]